MVQPSWPFRSPFGDNISLAELYREGARPHTSNEDDYHQWSADARAGTKRHRFPTALTKCSTTRICTTAFAFSSEHHTPVRYRTEHVCKSHLGGHICENR